MKKKGYFLVVLFLLSFGCSLTFGGFNNLSNYNVINPNPEEKSITIPLEISNEDLPVTTNYTGIGPSYPVSETFSEIVKSTSSQSGLRCGNNIDIGIPMGYPSQNASKISGMVTSLVENRDGAFDNDFSMGWENWSYYESDAGADSNYMYGNYASIDSKYIRISMQGAKYNIPDWTFMEWTDDPDFWVCIEDFYPGSETEAPGDHGTGSHYYGMRPGYDLYLLHLLEQGWYSIDYDLWGNPSYVPHSDSDEHVFVIQPRTNYLYDLLTYPGGGQELLSINLTTKFTLWSNYFDNPNNYATLYAQLWYQSGSTWHNENFMLWDSVLMNYGEPINPISLRTKKTVLTSYFQNFTYNTPFYISYYFYVKLESTDPSDIQELSLDIESVSLKADVRNARQFYDNSYAGLQSDGIYYAKDTIAGNFTFSYRLSSNWDDSGTNPTYACDHAEMGLWMSYSSTGSSAWVWTHSLDDDAFFIKDNNWYTIPDTEIDLTNWLGQSGTVDVFVFRLVVRWKDIWGPYTTENLTVDFDNLKFDYTANILPDEAGLYLHDATFGGVDVEIISTDFGSGVFDSGMSLNWTGTYQGGTTPNLQWVIKNPSYQGTGVNIEIAYSDILMEEAFTTTATSAFYCEANKTNSWYLEWTSAEKQDDLFCIAEQMEVEGLPAEWGSEYIFITPSSHGETVFHSSNVIINNSHSNTMYNLVLSSSNELFEQILNIRILENSSGFFFDGNVVYPTNFTMLGLNCSYSNSYVNMTLWNATRSGQEALFNGQIVYQEFLKVGPSYNYSNPWQIPLDAIPGQWMYELRWNNSLTTDNLTMVGHVILPLEVRRSTITTGIVFGKEITGEIGPGNSSMNAINWTIDSDPLSINITWTDLHTGTGVTYYEKAYLNVTGDYGPPDVSPYDDLPPYTYVQKNLTRDGNSFFYKITQTDYDTWCYTGLHNFTIVLQSGCTEFNSTTENTLIIPGSFYVVTNINMTLDPTASFTDPPAAILEGDLLHLKVKVFDVSHNMWVDNRSGWLNAEQRNPWHGGVVANWNLVFPEQYGNFSKSGSTPTNGTLLQNSEPGCFETYVMVDPLCDPVNGSNPFPNDYYYFDISVSIAVQDSLHPYLDYPVPDWKAELVFCKNNTPTPDPEPYTMPSWGRIEVYAAPSIRVEYPQLDMVLINSTIKINGTAYGNNQPIDMVWMNDSRFTLTTNPQGNFTGTFEFFNNTQISEGVLPFLININNTAGESNNLTWWFYFDKSSPITIVTNPIPSGVNLATNLINISGFVNGTGSKIRSISINDSRFSLFQDPSANFVVSFEFHNITYIPDGNYFVEISAVDSAPFSSNTIHNFVIDTISPTITLDSPQNATIVEKPNYLNLTISDLHLASNSIQWKANITQTTWTNNFTGSHDIDVGSFASNQIMQFWVRANDSAGNSAISSFIITFDNSQPSIILNSPINNTVIKKPATLNLTIGDWNLDPTAVEWKANVTQTTWTNTFVGSWDIDLTDFSSNQVIQFWIRAYDTYGHSNLSQYVMEFDDLPPSIVLESPANLSVMQVHTTIDLSIKDKHLNPSTVQWKANVTQTAWSSFSLGYYDIDLANFSSNQVVCFWVRANDTLGNQNLVSLIFTFDDIPPAQPIKVDYTYMRGNLTLRWIGSFDTIYYQIWRNDTCLGNTSNNFYSDLSTLKPDFYYEYKIIPFDEAGNAGDPLIINIRIPKDRTILFIILTVGMILGTSAIVVACLYFKLKKTNQSTKEAKRIVAKRDA